MNQLSKHLLGFLACFAFMPLIGCGRSSVEPIVNADAAKIEAAASVKVNDGDWPWWHGPDRNASIEKFSVPDELNVDEHLNWKIALPGEGHASPIVIGDRIFIACAEKLAATLSLICYDAKDGSQVWKTKLHDGSFMRSHAKNSHASATPASDGKSIYTSFMIDGGIQVSSISIDGDIQWQKTAGSFSSRHGYGSSPAIYKSLVIVNGDNDGSGFVAALDRGSGKVVWRTKRDSNASFATPIVVNTSGRDQLLLSGHNKLISYNPASGTELWNAKGTSPTTANTAAWNDEIVITTGGYPEDGVFAINSDGSGETLWEKKLKLYVPSPLIADDKVLITGDNGVLHCLDIATGATLWKQRLDADCSGSPVRIGETFVQGNESGGLLCYKIEPEFELLAKLELDSRIMSTPAVCSHGMLIRTDDSLYCFSLDAN